MPTPHHRYDTIVVGVGAMGSATCYELAKRGRRVLGLEQFRLAHDRGSSHGGSRMIRMCYHEHPDYVPVLREAYRLWREIEDESGRELLTVTGGLYMGTPDCPLIRGAKQSAATHGLDGEALSHDEVRRRYPLFRLPEEAVGFFEPTAGFLRPEAAVTAFTRAAIDRRAEVHEDEPVLSWTDDGHGVTVTTGRETYTAANLVFTAGAWTNRLITQLGVPLRVTRQVQCWVSPPRPERFSPDRLPAWVYEYDDEDHSHHYGFPIFPGSGGLKIAQHHRRHTVADLDQFDRTPTPADEQGVRDVFGSVFPAAEGPTAAVKVCIYTNTPDRFFIVDRLPGSPNVLVGGGFSGHGFKFASVIGRGLADLATDGHTDLPLSFLGLERFTRPAAACA